MEIRLDESDMKALMVESGHLKRESVIMSMRLEGNKLVLSVI